MFFALPKIARLTVFFSGYNIIVWSIEWFRFHLGMLEPSLFALLPQTILTIWFMRMIRSLEQYEFHLSAALVALLLWLSLIVVSSIDLLFPSEQLPWSISVSLLEALGYPALEISYGGAAPFNGLFHSNQGDLNLAQDWYFDGGIQFSWLMFNILSIALIMASMRYAVQDKRNSYTGLR